MVKKRLTDLLREEALNSSNGDTEAAQDSQDNAQSGKAGAAKTTAEESPEDNATPRSKRSNPTKADLQATVTELRATLKATQGRESQLEKKVAQLQAELQTQQPMVEKLQADLEQIDQVKADLEQAKETILQLSELNARLSAQEKSTDSTPPAAKSTKAKDLSLVRLPHPPSRPEFSSNKIAKADMGWVD